MLSKLKQQLAFLWGKEAFLCSWGTWLGMQEWFEGLPNSLDWIGERNHKIQGDHTDECELRGLQVCSGKLRRQFLAVVF